MSLHPSLNHLTGENIVNNDRAKRWKEPGFLNEFVSTASLSTWTICLRFVCGKEISIYVLFAIALWGLSGYSSLVLPIAQSNSALVSINYTPHLP